MKLRAQQLKNKTAGAWFREPAVAALWRYAVNTQKHVVCASYVEISASYAKRLLKKREIPYNKHRKRERAAGRRRAWK